MSILVTGAAGYIGSHVCLELLNSGYDVVAVDNYSNSCKEALVRVEEITGKSMTCFEADLRDSEALDEIFKHASIDAVLHFAALKAVGESTRLPLAYYRNNLESTLTLCEVMRRHGVKRLVFSSSATVYGAPDSVPITEAAPMRCTNPYGWTKYMNEQILNDLAASDCEWSVALLRYFNPIGAHASGKIGEDPKGIPNNLVPYIAQVAIGKRSSVSIFGNDYPTPDGTGVRDYIHVVDLARGHILALKHLFEHRGVETFNLGTGRGYSVLEVLHAYEKACGHSIAYTIAARRAGDIASCYADPSKAAAVLGFTALNGIDEMCADSWRWQQQNPDGYGLE